MGWFRAKRRGSGWLALFALAIQFSVAFGHIHFKAGELPSQRAAIAAAVTLDGDAAVGKDHPAADVFCDICATFNLAATSQASAAPTLALPVFSVVQASVPAPDDAALPERRFRLAQSRAPPAV